MARRGLWPCALLLLAVGASAQHWPCPAVYNRQDNLLFGNLPNAECRLAWSGVPCHASRSTWWFQHCKWNAEDSDDFVCTAEQKAEGLKLAGQLHGGAPTQMSPCELYPFIRGRTLWLIGDSHQKQLFRALQCILIDFWDQQECLVSEDDELVRQLDDLPYRHGESKCMHVLGNGRICLVGAVMGTSLLDNDKVADGGVLNLLRWRLAAKDDIFVVNFGIWHTKEGEPGYASYRESLRKLGEDWQRVRGQWPHTFFRETPMSHEKDTEANTCREAPPGWVLDFPAGRLTPQPNARASRETTQLLNGGPLNWPAREILSQYQVPMLGGYDISVPLHSAHPALRGTPELDCLHYCSAGLPELMVYELTRVFKEGATGLKPLEGLDEKKRLPCKNTPGWYRRRRLLAGGVPPRAK